MEIVRTEAEVHTNNNSFKKDFEIFDTINPALLLLITISHAIAFYQLVLICKGDFTWGYFIYQVMVSIAIGLSITAGAHRLWSHRSYKANLPLRIILMTLHTLTFQGPLYTWARWHRQHHKFSDTDGDPHNARRGFFYSQIGWFMVYDHQKFLRNSAGQIESADLETDGVVMWQNRNYYWWGGFLLIIQIMLPLILGLETCVFRVITAICFGTCQNLFAAGSVNSFAHMWGTRPYDKSILPRQNAWVAFLALGEGWHNYHHAFPWDYKTSEYGVKFNLTKTLIDFFHYIGWASDLKTASGHLVAARVKRTGDSLYPHNMT